MCNDELVSKGRINFSPNTGVPERVNHKQAYESYLADINESQFCAKEKLYAALTKEFYDGEIKPSANFRPTLPLGRISSITWEAATGGY